MDDIQHDILKFLQKDGDCPGLGPYGGETDQHGEGQGAHYGHDLRNVQLEGHLGQSSQPLHLGGNTQMGKNGITRGHGQKGGQDAGEISQCHRYSQHTGGVAAQLGNGGGNKADNDKGYAEGDELSQNVVEGDHHFHGAFRKHKAQGDP